MKFLPSQLLHYAKFRPSPVNLRAIGRFLAILLGLIVLYSVLFHYLMAYEGRSESVITGLYWTLTVMTTLGFGDITFHSDLGRLFSTLVLVSGVIFLLILLPFTFIEFFYEPWMKAQQAARAPRRLAEKIQGHVILINYDAVTDSLIDKLKQYNYPYVLIIPELNDALRLHDLGFRVMLGDLDNPETYVLARADRARLVVLTANDQLNTNIAATVQDVSETVPIVATANFAASVDILMLAGCSEVLQLGEMMGQALARRIPDGETLAHIIGQFGDLMIAEALVRDTALVGQSLRESRLRETVGVNILGVWNRGSFQAASPDFVITADMVLVMAGSEADIARYNAQFRMALPPNMPILIIGAGRVGKATSAALAARGLDYRIIEKSPGRAANNSRIILGDGAELEILEQAGIRDTPAIIITTHDDDMNIYLTIYCRRLRPDAQIISRATLERNVATLHRAGADFVMSYASTGANAVMNLLGRENILMVTEGLEIFEVEVPDSLAGKTLAESKIRKETGCTVVAMEQAGQLELAVDPCRPIRRHTRMVLIGTPEAEEAFLVKYKSGVP